ncbi:MAG: NADH-quinone oxidoreductase subunit M [Planctomycetota bacterium]|nr:NADH-quinone oxidoreductase subunit M [Planctomycetota bacterium]
MENAGTLLAASLVVPLIGAALILLLAGQRREWAARLALATTLLTLLLAGVVVFGYSPDEGLEYAVVDQTWLGAQTGLDVRLSVGLDGLGLWFYGLSALLMVTSVLVSWEAIRDRAGTFYAMLLLLETGMLGVFVARDIILFYVFFEFTLIPLFFLIGIWGSEQRRYAAMKFFLFTLAGSVLTFLGLLSIVLWHFWQPGSAGLTFSIPELTAAVGRQPMPLVWQYWVFAALFVGFAIKVPLFPFHTWLPLAHVQAPTAGSVLLAGVLLKIGTYGFARFNLPLLPDATAALAPWLLWISVAGIIYGALVALAQSDIKRLIAYSSVSHLGFCMLGLFALNRLGTQGGVLQAVNHGLSTGALFAIVGMIYERYHTRRIADLGGIAVQVPVLAFCMVFFTFSSIGLPGLNGFAGELLLLLGMFQRAWQTAMAGGGWQLMVIAVLAVSGVVLGAWYMLWLVQRVFFGPLKQPSNAGDDQQGVQDLSYREVFALAPLAVFVLWIGIQPKFFLDRMAPSLSGVAAAAEESWELNSQDVRVAVRDDSRH